MAKYQSGTIALFRTSCRTRITDYKFSNVGLILFADQRPQVIKQRRRAKAHQPCECREGCSACVPLDPAVNLEYVSTKCEYRRLGSGKYAFLQRYRLYSRENRFVPIEHEVAVQGKGDTNWRSSIGTKISHWS